MRLNIHTASRARTWLKRYWTVLMALRIPDLQVPARSCKAVSKLKQCPVSAPQGFG